LAGLRQLARTALPEPGRAQRIAKNGRIVEVSLTASVLVDEAGEPYAVAMTEKAIE
jgi:two-component system CheB/CheR fusion protein